MAATLDLGSNVERRVGSSPTKSTKCSDGVIGSRPGLKIQWSVMIVRVQVPLGIQKNKIFIVRNEFFPFLLYLY